MAGQGDTEPGTTDADAAGASPVINALVDLIHLAVLLASRIRLAGLALAALVVVALVVAVRRWRRKASGG